MTTTPQSAQDATFEELKNSLFQELYELCLLGGQACVIIKSADGKLHTFGYPSVDVVANRFLNLSSASNGSPFPEGENEAVIRQRFKDMLALVEAEKDRKENNPPAASTSGSP